MNIEPDQTIMVLAVVFTVVLAIINVLQVFMAQKGVNPLEADGAPKYIAIIVMIALLVLMIAHIVTAVGDKGVGKDELSIMLPGVLAIIFTITTAGAFFMKDKLADKAQLVYFISLAALWICIIGHIVARVQF